VRIRNVKVEFLTFSTLVLDRCERSATPATLFQASLDRRLLGFLIRSHKQIYLKYCKQGLKRQLIFFFTKFTSEIFLNLPVTTTVSFTEKVWVVNRMMTVNN
jgi:hypothetical protein